MDLEPGHYLGPYNDEEMSFINEVFSAAKAFMRTDSADTLIDELRDRIIHWSR